MTERSAWHFIGIGGIGMSGLAAILLDRGESVSGCDGADGPVLQRLRDRGARIWLGHSPDHLEAGMRVVVSSAIAKDEPEVCSARERGLTVLHRGDLLAELFRDSRGVAISGTHGKSTTTGLTAFALRAAGLDPTVVVGANLPDMGGNAHNGHDRIIVAEADESDGSFTKIAPTVAVVTNVDDDHLDHHGSMDGLARAFRDFVRRVQPGGRAVVCGDDRLARAAAEGSEALLYGMTDKTELQARDVQLDGWGSSFEAAWQGRSLGTVRLALPGQHNVLNALAALGAGLSLGLEADGLIAGLASFHGAGRRFQVLGQAGGITVIDDYAHHPTEIATTLRAGRQVAPERLIVLFQPHRYSRTRNLADEFGAAFDQADLLLVAPIYGAGERPLPGVDAGLIEAAVRRHGRPPVERFEDRADMVKRAAELVRPGDLVMTMGAGDIRRDGEALVRALQAQAPQPTV